VSDPGPAGGSSPLERLPFFAELARIPGGDGPVHWDVARRVAAWVAGGGRPEPPVPAPDVVQLGSVGRVAELAVAEVVPFDVGAVSVVAVTRAEWALRLLDGQASLLDAMARALAGDQPPDPDHRPAGLAPPVLEGLVFGWMAGQLSGRALGQYDPALPRPPTARLSIPSANLDQVAGEWGLPLDEVRLWAALQDVAHHAVLARPHVREAFGALLGRYVASFEVDPHALDEQLEDLDPSDPASFRAALGDPESVVAAIQTPAQADAVARLEALSAALEGWAAHVVDGIAGRLLGGYPALSEAVRRRRAEASWGDRYVARLLGVGLRQPAYERGRVFVDGVVERAGEDGLARLWASAEDLPTPAEVDAPGLWLARIDL
jgi:putative hydrolase